MNPSNTPARAPQTGELDGVVLIGDELACAAFQLAGVAVRCPAPAAVAAALREALQQASMVILSPRCADALAPEVLRQAQLIGVPPVVVMPDLVEPVADAGFQHRLRAVLGIET